MKFMIEGYFIMLQASSTIYQAKCALGNLQSSPCY